MAKSIQKYLVRDDYFHDLYEMTRYGKRSWPKWPRENTTTYPAPALNNAATLLSTALDFANNGQLEDLLKLLKDDFHIRLVISDREVSAHIKTDGEYQANTLTYDYHELRPNLEVLVMQDGHLGQLLSACNNYDVVNNTTLTAAVLQQLHTLDLADDESADFSLLNLIGANFRQAKLGNSNFSGAITTNADFYGADLAHCLINQVQLDSSTTYEGATLPNGIIPYWNTTTRENILAKLEQMKSYVDNHIEINDPKFTTVHNLYTSFAPLLENKKDLSSDQKRSLLKSLKSAEPVLSTHRNLKYLLAELISIVGLLVVGYVIAAMINKIRNNHYGLFTQPKTEQQVIATEAAVEQVMPTEELTSPTMIATR